MNAKRVLVVDDEPEIQRFLKVALEASGYTVIQASSGAEAMHMAVNRAPDVVVLDLGLPDIEGTEVLRRLRSISKLPVLVLSARDREADKIEALDLGADDYVQKPFGIGEFMARLRAALRHAGDQTQTDASLDIDGLKIDFERRLVSRDGATIRLTPKEYDLLCVLARHAGRVVTHRQILSAVWGPAHTDDSQYLRVFIGQLRSKIEKDPAAPCLILTEAGIGYRFAETATAVPSAPTR